MESFSPALNISLYLIGIFLLTLKLLPHKKQFDFQLKHSLTAEQSAVELLKLSP